MYLPIRISTAPPSLSDVAGDEMSFYCDLYETQDWRAYAIARELPSFVGSAVSRPEAIAYVVRMTGDREIGLLFCYEGGEDWLTYCSVDEQGTVTEEPAANEALWKAANLGSRLPDGHRLARVSAMS